jgi:hypothetical protein
MHGRVYVCERASSPGQTELKAGDYVDVVMSRYPLPTVSFSEHNTEWFRSITAKLNWNVRIAQKAFQSPAGAPTASAAL